MYVCVFSLTKWFWTAHTILQTSITTRWYVLTILYVNALNIYSVLFNCLMLLI